MKKCLLCEQGFTPVISFAKIFSLKKYRELKICRHCQNQFQRLTGKQCAICSRMLDKGIICNDCERWKRIYQGDVLHNHALYRYDSTFHDLMVSYKRRGDYAMREILQELCYEYLVKNKYDYYVPVPTSPEHQQRRQFDTISAIYGDILPLTTVLIKKKGSHAQGEKNKEERLKTPQSFLVDKTINIRENEQTGKVLILDDIYTTGRTLYYARDCLKEVFPGMQIESFSICR